MEYDIAIFDLDGTLLDTIKDLGAAVNHALAQHGFPLRKEEEFPGLVGRGIRNLVKDSLPADRSSDNALIDRVLADFTQYYCDNIDRFSRPYDGIPEVISSLSEAGVQLAVASNKFQEGAETLVREFFGNTDWIAVLGNKAGAPLKPDPAIVRSVLETAKNQSKSQRQPVPAAGQMASAERRAIFIGDSAVDIQTAKNGGIASIGVTWGYRPEANLCHADFIVHTPEEITAIIL